MGLPLDGVRILAMTQYEAGPFAMLSKEEITSLRRKGIT